MSDTRSRLEAAPSAEVEATTRRRSARTVAIVAAVMVVEGVALFIVVRSLGGRAERAVAAVEPVLGSAGAGGVEVEIPIAKVRALNLKSGQPVLYSARVVVRSPSRCATESSRVLESKHAAVEDAVARVIREAAPSNLTEAGFGELRRRIRAELDRIGGPQVTISEVIISECRPYPSGF